MKLHELFACCIAVSYSEVGSSSNYAARRVGHTLYLFFEDSDGEIDWKRNLNFPAKAYKRTGDSTWFAHRGFLRVWKEIEPSLVNEITDKTVEKIVIAGYSHGAAVAVLCHEYVWYHRPDLRNAIEGYGFGCPRVFWGMKTPNLKRRWARFTVIRNVDDLVTHLPPVFLGYSHVGALLEIGEKGKYSAIDAHRAENIQKELLLSQSKK